MATKTFEELKQLAIQIRDEKTNKQNTATRIGTQMLEHLNKLEQDYYDKTATDEELKQRDEKLTELSSYMILSWDTDKSTTRKSVPQKDRKVGMLISYKEFDKEWVIEKYIGTHVSDVSWGDTDANWERIISDKDVYTLDYLSAEVIEDMEEGFYQSDGSINTEFTPQYYKHSLFAVDGCKLITVLCDNIGVNGTDASIVYFDNEKNVLQVLPALYFADGKINYTNVIDNVSYVGVNAFVNSKICKVYKHDNTFLQELISPLENKLNTLDSIIYVDYPSEIIEDIAEGFYKGDGTVDTSFSPEYFRHSLVQIVHPGCKLSVKCSNIGVNNQQYPAIVILDEDKDLISAIYSETTSVDYTAALNKNVKFVGVNVYYKNATYQVLETYNSDNSEKEYTNIEISTNIGDLGNLDIAYPGFDYNHIIVYGQSFTQNDGDVDNNNEVPNTYQLGNTCLANSDKSTANLTTLQNGSRVAIELVKSFAQLCKRKRLIYNFIASSGGASGQQIENIGKGTSYYNNLINELQRLKEISNSENKSIGCIGIIFLQGESNYAANSGTYTNNKSEYKYLVKKLKEDLQEDIKNIYEQENRPIFITYQTGYKWIRKNNSKLTITQAQVELAEEMEDVIMGCPSYQVTFNSTTHPNGNGYAWLGELMAKHLFYAEIRNERYDTPHPLSFKINSNILEILCYVPNPPLVINDYTSEEVQDYGFEILKNAASVKIDSVISSGNKIIIKASQNIDDGICEVTYAGLNRNGEGNICDSDKYSSRQLYLDDTSDDLVKFPVDINGRRIIGKRIPLQNWLCNFYYNLNFHFIRHYLELKVTDEGIANALYNSFNLPVTYSSSNTDVANVDINTGVINPLQTGYAVINAKIEYNNREYNDDYLLIIAPNSVSL